VIFENDQELEERITTMTVLSSVPAGDDFERQLAAAEPDMLRAMVKSFAEALMSRRPMRSAAPSTASRLRSG